MKASKMLNANEKLVWEGSPSQWLALKWHVLLVVGVVIGLAFSGVIIWKHVQGLPVSPAYYAGLVCFAVIPVWLWNALVVGCIKFILSDERLIVWRGVINRRKSQLEIYRVYDIELMRPWYLRLVGLSHIGLVTYDTTSKNMVIEAIPNEAMLDEKLRKLVDIARMEKGVRDYVVN